MISVNSLLKDFIVDALAKVVIASDPINGSCEWTFPTEEEIDALVIEYARDIKRAVLESIIEDKEGHYLCVQCGKLADARCEHCGSNVCEKHGVMSVTSANLVCQDCYVSEALS